jgi:copper homeostasis protein CutC
VNADYMKQYGVQIAGVIRGYLDAHKEVDLEALRSLIQAALA